MASERTLSERMLSIRDRAFADLGDYNLKNLRVEGVSPKYTIDKVIDYTPDAAAERGPPRGGPRDRAVLPEPGRLPAGIALPARSGRPARSASPATPTRPRFICNIPRSATPDNPARPSLYGHGLFGDAGEVGADNVEQLGNENNVIVCGADFIGMADEDVGNAISVLQDLSRLPDAWPTASSRASSTSCTSAGR